MKELTPTMLRDLLSQNGIILSRRFGQNFLIDRNILAAMADCLPEGKDIVFVEIGAGALALTAILASHGKRVVAYEIDRKLLPLHTTLLRGDPAFCNTEVRYEDALEADWCSIAQAGEIPVLAGNLPYLRSSEIVLKLIRSECLETAFLMFQREFALRLLAHPGTGDYGSLTVATQTFFDVHRLLDLPPDVFFPRPGVSSIFLKFSRHENDIAPAEIEPFLHFVQQAFMHRRKKLVSFFRQCGVWPNESLCGISDLRPEALTPLQFLSLFRLVAKIRTS